MTYIIKSNFVKRKIKGKPFSKRHTKYFRELLFIEKWVTGKTWGMASSMRWRQMIMGEYPKEIKAIWTELDPNGYKRFIEREEKIKNPNRSKLRGMNPT